MDSDLPDPSQIQWDTPVGGGNDLPDASQIKWNDQGSNGPKLGPSASKIVRPLAQAAMAGPALLGDAATAAANFGGGLIDKAIGKKESDMQMPSTTFERMLDKYTTKPKTGFEKGAELVESALFSPGMGELGAGAIAGAKKLSKLTTQAAKDAVSSGYKLSPSYIGGQVAKDLQTVAGGPKLSAQISSHNMDVTDRLAKADLGLHPNHELDEQTFDALREEAYKPYEQVADMGSVFLDDRFTRDVINAGGHRLTGSGSIAAPANSAKALVDAEKARFFKPEVDGKPPTFNGKDMLQEIKTLRYEGSRNLRIYDPEKNLLGYVQRDIAKAMEDQIDRQASRTGSPGLMQQLQAARKQLAKIETVSDATGPGGHIRAADLVRLYKASKPLDGNLKTIAVTGYNFPKDLQAMAEKGETGDFSAVDFMLGGTGLALHHPSVAAVSGSRFGIRKLLQSGVVQRRMLNGPVKMSKAATGFARKAAPIVANEAIANYSSPPDLGESPDLGENVP